MNCASSSVLGVNSSPILPSVPVVTGLAADVRRGNHWPTQSVAGAITLPVLTGPQLVATGESVSLACLDLANCRRHPGHVDFNTRRQYSDEFA